VWDASTGAELKVLNGHTETVYTAAFSPNGTRIVSGSGDKSVRVWDASTGAELKVLNGHSSYVYSVAFSPDGTRIVSGSYDNSVRVWDASTGAKANKVDKSIQTGDVHMKVYADAEVQVQLDPQLRSNTSPLSSLLSILGGNVRLDWISHP